MKRTLILSAVLVTLVAGFAVAMQHETDALIALDEQWGAAAGYCTKTWIAKTQVAVSHSTISTATSNSPSPITTTIG